MNGQAFGKEANVTCIGIMNLPAISGSAGVLAGETHNPPAGMPALPGSWRTDTMRLELTAFVAIIVLLNLPLFKGACAAGMIFLPDRVAAGEWWRLFTYSSVHVSWYHL